MMLIDVSTVLRQTVSCELYSNLVTRPTGRAVRSVIESLLAGAQDRTITVIDFSHVGMIDFSCADEVVAKLLLLNAGEDGEEHASYFLFRGVTDDHWDAIETVLEVHNLALVMETSNGARVVGTINEDDRGAWQKVYELGRTGAESLSFALNRPAAACEHVLRGLHRRGLLMRLGEDYVAIGSAGAMQ